MTTKAQSETAQPADSTPSANLPNVLKVYRLIKAMSPAQKGQFRKYSKFWGERSKDTKITASKKESTPFYLQLFDLLNKFINEGREEEGLQKYLERNRLGNRTVLSDRAEHLYEYMLESLRNEPDKGRLNHQINQLLQDINMLYHKGLEKDALPLLAKARKIALIIDKPAYLLELLWWEGTLRAAETERSRASNAVETRRLEAEQCIRHFKQIEALKGLTLVLGAEVRSAVPNLDSPLLSKWIELFDLPPQDAIKTLPGFRSKRLFLVAYRIYWEIQSVLQPNQHISTWKSRSFEATKAILRLHQGEFALFQDEEPAHYRIILENSISQCLIVKEFDYAESLIEELEKRDKSVSISVRLNYYLSKFDTRAAILYIEANSVLNNFPQKRHQFEATRQISLCYQCCIMYFMAGQYDKAQIWCNYVLAGHRPDAHNLAVTILGLLEVLCIYEQKAYGGSFTRVLDAFKSRQKRANQWSPIVQQLTDLIHAYVQHNAEEMQRTIPVLRTTILDNPNLLGRYATVLAWVESKIHHTDFLSELKKYD
ncbi:MAG TPA: hypothetical protein PK971_01860 [Saprospiraceae bacterium]|nr:hypothetical protein [Saprospiraceae bacterium]HND87039.1 hypothetical protein [Saprospiraceae bacterium]